MEDQTTEALEARRTLINQQRDALKAEAAIITAELDRRAARAAAAQKLAAMSPAERDAMMDALGVR